MHNTTAKYIPAFHIRNNEHPDNLPFDNIHRVHVELPFKITSNILYKKYHES